MLLMLKCQEMLDFIHIPTDIRPKGDKFDYIFIYMYHLGLSLNIEQFRPL